MGCSGHCCAAFSLPCSLPELRARAPMLRDGQLIAGMVIPLTPARAAARGARDADAETHWYTCRHWDEATRLCTIYDRRPEMCRDYPYGRPCEHGCDFQVDEATAAKWADIRARQGVRRLFSRYMLGLIEAQRDHDRHQQGG